MSDRKFEEPRALVEALTEEFHRLNDIHFAGALVLPTIDASKRKTYGGYYQLKRHRIVVSWQAYLDYGYEESLNTFRHEVAHIVYQDHSKKFWELAWTLGIKKRYAASPLKSHIRTPKYIYECPNCGKQILRYRAMRKSSCGQCDSKFNPAYQFKVYTYSQSV